MMNSLLQILEVAPEDKQHHIAQEYACWEQVKPVPTVDYITRVDIAGTKTYRFLLLLEKGNQEKLIDLVTTSDRFRDVVAVLRSDFPGWRYVEELPVGQDEEF